MRSRAPRSSAHAILSVGLCTSLAATFLIASPAGAQVIAEPGLEPSGIVLTSDITQFEAGETFTLTATVDHPIDGSLFVIEIVDLTNNEVVEQCDEGDQCEVELSFSAGGPREYQASVGPHVSEILSISRAPWSIALDSTSAELGAGEEATLTATVNQDLDSTQGAFGIAIFNTTVGTRVASCSEGRSCSVDVSSYDDPQQATTYAALVMDAADAESQTPLVALDVQAVATPLTIQRRAWTVELDTELETLAPGDETVITATFDQNLGGTNSLYSAYFYEASKGIFLGRCDDGSECSVLLDWTIADPWPGFVSVVIAERLLDPPSSFYELQDVLVYDSITINESEWEVALATDRELIGAGEVASLTASVNQDVGQTAGRYATYIVDFTNQVILSSCASGSVCEAGFSFYSENDRGATGALIVAIVAAPGAAHVNDLTFWKATSDTNTFWIDRRPWQPQLSYSGGDSLTLSTNQDVGQLGGSWVWHLFEIGSSGAVRKAICQTGQRCVMRGAGSVGNAGYVTLLARAGAASHPGELNTTIEAVSLNQYHAGRRFGPTLTSPFTGRGEMSGGGNPAQEPCNACHADPINTATGEFFLPETDLRLEGAGPRLTIARNFVSSSHGSPGPLGPGWTASFHAALRTLTPSDDTSQLPRQVEIEQENGSILQFTRDGTSSTFVAPDRVLATLSWDAAADAWVLVRREIEILRFDPAGRLVSVEDRDANALTFIYESEKLERIEAAGGRELILTWSGELVTAVSDSAGRQVNYGYDAEGRLAQVVSADQSVTTYEYDSIGNLTAVIRPGGARTENEYDDERRVVRQEDPLGRVTLFSYEPGSTTTTLPDGVVISEVYTDGMLMSQTLAAGSSSEATTQYTYTEQNLVATVTDPQSRVSTYAYDPAGNRTWARDALGRETTWTYGTHPSPISVTDPTGSTTTNTYTTSGRPSSSTSAEGSHQEWTYNPNGTTATYRDPNGALSTFEYDSAGRLISASDPLSRTTQFSYNAFGLVTETVAPSGATSRRTYDAIGRLLRDENGAGDVYEYTYDAGGNLLTQTMAGQGVITHTYDAVGQLVSTTDAEGGVTSYTHDARGNVQSQTDPNGFATVFSYNEHGQLLTTTDPLGRVTRHSYDAVGNRLTSEGPTGALTTFVYDAGNQLIETTDSEGGSMTFAYDAAGRLATSTDQLGRTAVSSYNQDGRLSEVQLPDATTELYEYDAAGNLVSYIDPDGTETTYSYDVNGLLISRADPGLLPTTFDYDDDGRIARKTLPSGGEIEFAYDAAGRLVSRSYEEDHAQDVTYSYDPAGRMASMSDSTGMTTFDYDRVGRVISEIDGDGAAIEYEYDAGGRLNTIEYPAVGKVSYEYDQGNQVVAVTDWANRRTEFSWLDDGRLSSQRYPNGLVQTRQQDATGRTLSLSTTNATDVVAKFDYTYDLAGQLSAQHTQLPDYQASSTFSRDLHGQLAGVSRVIGQAAQQISVAATPGGVLTVGDEAQVMAYNSAKQLVDLTPVLGAPRSYTYDSNGARTSETQGVNPGDEVTVYEYAAAGYLSKVSSQNETVEYTSDGRGLRKSRLTTTEEQFVWSTVRQTPLLLTDGASYYIYGPSTVPFAEVDIETGEASYLHSDDLGSVRMVSNAAGLTVGSATYSEFGSTLAASGETSRFGFTGNWTDPTTGLVYLRARDYDPATGQFLTVDPAIEDTRQPYTYASNNPVQLTDHSGLDPWGDFWGDMGGASIEVLNQIAFVTAGMLDGLSFNLYSGYAQGQASNYDCMKEEYRIYYNAGQVGVMAGSLVALAGAAWKVPALESTIAISTRRAVIDAGKLEYFFGGVTSSAHNTARSLQNVKELAKIGIWDNAAGHSILTRHLEEVASSTTNITRSYTTEWGSFQVRESLLAGPGGFVKLESTWQVTSDSLKLTTFIPKTPK